MSSLARTLLEGYAGGVFPMADSATAETLHWVDPHLRGVLPLDGLHISRSLARRIAREPFTLDTDTDCTGVVAGCAARPETWINAPLRAFYAELHELGIVHSLEVREGADLVGGIFGLQIGAAFFGESMFSRRTDASKIALAYLVDRLRLGGFTLFDTQFLTGHLQRLGGREMPRERYRALLEDAVATAADFNAAGALPSGQVLLQRSTQTS